MNDLIEKLKDKNYVRAFGLMTPEEQKLLRKANTSNCLFYNPRGNWLTIRCDMDFDQDRTYAIKPDYKPDEMKKCPECSPEPEYEDLEIGIYRDDSDNEWLAVFRDSNCDFLPYSHNLLHCLPSLPNFEGFIRKPTMTIEEKWFLQGVAKQISEGKTVYARFRS